MKKLYYVLLGILCLIQIMHASQVTPLTANSITAASLNYAASANTGLFIITSAGYYYLTEDLLLSQTPTNVNNAVILINASNVVLDLGTKTIAGNGNASNVVAGIQVADGISNVTIKNGSINGISSTISNAYGFGILVNLAAASTVSHIVLQDLSIFTCGALGIVARKCNDLTMLNITCTNNGPAFDGVSSFGYSGGLYLETVNTCSIKKSSFSNSAWRTTPSAAGIIHIVGAAISACNNIEILDSHFDNNNNSTPTAVSSVSAAGLFLLNSANCTVANVTANQNTRSGITDVPCFGFRMTGSTGSIFTNCQANNNVGTTFCTGFGLESSSSGNTFVNCIANLNNCVIATATSAASSYGFYCLNNSGNVFTSCFAIRNNTPGSTDVSNPLRSVAGFFSAGSTSNVFLKCFADRNFLSTQSGTNSYAAGFQLGDQTPFTPITGYPPAGGATTFVESGAILRECISNNNTTLNAATSAPAFGILILPGNVTFASGGPVSAGNSIENCRVSYNVSQNTAAGRSYGIVDVTPGRLANGATPAGPFGSTTFLNTNISVGHGASLASATNSDAKTPITSFNMNYYLDYRTSANGSSHLSYVIIESSAGYISNLSNNATTASYNLQSWSLLYS